MSVDRNVLRKTLAKHFIMWRFLDVPRGEWSCSCGLKFGFSDSAIDHQAAAIADALAEVTA